MSGCPRIISLSLKITEAYPKVEAPLSPLGVLQSLVNLSLEESGGLIDGHLAFLSSFKGLRSLNLKNCRKISDDGASHIAHLSTLDFLDVSGSNLTPTGFLELSNTQSQLRHLVLRDCKALSDESLFYFSKFPLIELNISNCKMVTDDGMSVRPHLSSAPLFQSSHPFPFVAEIP